MLEAISLIELVENITITKTDIGRKKRQVVDCVALKNTVAEIANQIASTAQSIQDSGGIVSYLQQKVTSFANQVIGFFGALFTFKLNLLQVYVNLVNSAASKLLWLKDVAAMLVAKKIQIESELIRLCIVFPEPTPAPITDPPIPTLPYTGPPTTTISVDILCARNYSHSIACGKFKSDIMRKY